jgi:hypothetical protein
MAERAMEQAGEERFFEVLDGDSNPIAIVVKHLAGNMRSRWTGFLTTDGEKPDRRRDEEFLLEDGDDQPALMARWEAGWALLSETVSSLDEADLSRVVTIRGEPHTVLQALQRQLTHYAYHAGQIVFLARHLVGDGWQSLSIARGMSERMEVARDGTTYVVDEGEAPPRG